MDTANLTNVLNSINASFDGYFGVELVAVLVFYLMWAPKLNVLFTAVSQHRKSFPTTVAFHRTMYIFTGFAILNILTISTTRYVPQLANLAISGLWIVIAKRVRIENSLYLHVLDAISLGMSFVWLVLFWVVSVMCVYILLGVSVSNYFPYLNIVATIPIGSLLINVNNWTWYSYAATYCKSCFFHLIFLDIFGVDKKILDALWGSPFAEAVGIAIEETKADEIVAKKTD